MVLVVHGTPNSEVLSLVLLDQLRYLASENCLVVGVLAVDGYVVALCYSEEVLELRKLGLFPLLKYVVRLFGLIREVQRNSFLDCRQFTIKVSSRLLEDVVFGLFVDSSGPHKAAIMMNQHFFVLCQIHVALQQRHAVLHLGLVHAYASFKAHDSVLGPLEAPASMTRKDRPR